MRSKAKGIIDLYISNEKAISIKELATKMGFILKENDNEIPDLKAVSIYNERTSQYIIIYDEKSPKQDYYIAHEIGHIVNGHFKDGNLVKRGKALKKKYEELESKADEFAIEILQLIK